MKYVTYGFKVDPDGDQFSLEELQAELKDRLKEFTMADFFEFNEKNYVHYMIKVYQAKRMSLDEKSSSEWKSHVIGKLNQLIAYETKGVYNESN